MGVLLDTNVLSELARSKPDPRVVHFCSELVEASVSVVTLHELRFGSKLVKAKPKRERLLNWMQGIVEGYSEAIIPVSEEIAKLAADLRASASNGGRTLDIEDALIAATALSLSCPLATRNIKDFIGMGVSLVDPWKA